MTVLAALARAGSMTQAAGHEVLIVRAPKRGSKDNSATEAEPEILRINLEELKNGNVALNVQLLDGDTVNVPKGLSVFVTGQVKASGAYSVDPNTTVLQALSLAGGMTDRGSEARIKIVRTVNGKKTEVKVKLTDIVLPGDTIVVPERFF